MAVNEDPELSAEEKFEELELENDMLRSKIAALERELQGRSPTKKNKKALAENKFSLGYSDVENTVCKMDEMSLEEKAPPKTPGKTPGKKQRKLTTRKWDLAMEEDLSP